MSALDSVLPPARDLPGDVDRHRLSAASTRTLMRSLLTDTEPELGSWPRLVELLIAVGRTDIPMARLVEAHVDALRIHAEAGSHPQPGALYAVWASRSHDTGLRGWRSGEAWLLDGDLRFASGAGVVDRALIPVWTDAETHVLLDLDVGDWSFDETAWRTRAMAPARSHQASLRAHRVCAEPVGPANFYLSRAGFFPGGVGVAAAWAGGAARVLDLATRCVAPQRRTPAQVVRLGYATTDLVGAVASVRQAARTLDEPTHDPRMVPTLTRAGVAAAVRRLLTHVRSLVGPAGLALDEDLTRAVDDLALFVAQQNEDADAAWIGEDVW